MDNGSNIDGEGGDLPSRETGTPASVTPTPDGSPHVSGGPSGSGGGSGDGGGLKIGGTVVRVGVGDRPVKPRGSRQLNPKQRLFVEHYIATSSPKQAAILAGYKPHRADKTGSKLLKKRWIQEAIRERMAVQMARIDCTAEKVLRETALVAFSSIADYSMGKDGILRLSGRGVDPASIRAVQHYKRRERFLKRIRDDGGEECDLIEIETEIKLHDKSRALFYLLQHLGLLKQPTPATPEDPVRELLKRLPADVAASLSQVLAGAEPSAVATGNVGANPVPDGSGSEPDSGVSPVS